MTEPATLPTLRSWLPAGELHQRGTVLLFPGRGEHGGVYERLGRRLSADAYAVHAADSTPGDDLDTLARLVDEVAATSTGPIVLAGSDTGALQALAVAAGRSRPPDGVIIAGLAAFGTTPQSSWTDELEARTACPTHRQRLTDDIRFVRGSLSAPPPAALLSAELPLDRISLPVLLLHGDADPVTPPATARSIAARLPAAELGIVRGGRHDVLNDLDHRSVAAHVVQWLERLRSGPDSGPVVVVESLS
ncbi:alpha/beta hydrolase [Actinoallomurus iriomotensis]|uniref:Lysophospholipase n=1 Tax=Actinoallomurus iriomotensis TaxID=478107 RepID=A0A9W6S4D4_9ACTN|nr:alpha/beta fold hydrolase [Actinoallomurus iriomotensis]GLY85412.1 lysophospholipase [Actinoallomurus iriomotensis]